MSQSHASSERARDPREYRARLELPCARYVVDELLVPIDVVALALQKQLDTYGIAFRYTLPFFVSYSTFHKH